MYTPYPDIVGATYNMPNLLAECQRCVNYLPEHIQSGKSENAFWLRPYPGLVLQSTLPTYPIRGIHKTATNRVFIVASTVVYEYFENKTYTVIGTLSHEIGPIRMRDNGQTVFLTHPQGSYTLILSTNTLAPITDESFLGAEFIEFLDQFIITSVPNTTFYQYFLAQGEGPFDYNAVDITAEESSPDNITAMYLNGRELWVFGTESCAVHVSTTEAELPFARIRDAVSNIGIIAPSSLAGIQGRIAWLGSSKEGNNSIWSNSGLQPLKISNLAMDQEISSYTYVADATAFTFSMNGHVVYQINFPTANKSWGYDFTTEQWFELVYQLPSTGEFRRHKANYHCFAFNKNLVTDHRTGAIYELTFNAYTDAGDITPRLRRMARIANLGQRIFYQSMRIQVTTGAGVSRDGLSSDTPALSGENPLIRLRFSDDFGQTWSSYREEYLGLKSDSKPFVEFFKLGSAINRIFEVSVTEPVFVGILTSYLLLDSGEW